MRYQIQIGENNPILRAISEPVKSFDGDVKSFGQELMHLMYKWDGVGLAAPQVGKNIRMIVVTQWKRNKIIKEFVMVNPEIVWTSGHMILGEEACLSLPDILGDVKRDQTIVVQYQDLDGRKQERKFKQMAARVIQHEVDHLDGILFVDKMVG